MRRSRVSDSCGGVSSSSPVTSAPSSSSLATTSQEFADEEAESAGAGVSGATIRDAMAMRVARAGVVPLGSASPACAPRPRKVFHGNSRSRTLGRESSFSRRVQTCVNVFPRGDAWASSETQTRGVSSLFIIWHAMQFNKSDQSSDTPASVRAALAATRRAVRVGRRAESIGDSRFDPP